MWWLEETQKAKALMEALETAKAKTDSRLLGEQKAL